MTHTERLSSIAPETNGQPPTEHEVLEFLRRMAHQRGGILIEDTLNIRPHRSKTPMPNNLSKIKWYRADVDVLFNG